MFPAADSFTYHTVLFFVHTKIFGKTEKNIIAFFNALLFKSTAGFILSVIFL